MPSWRGWQAADRARTRWPTVGTKEHNREADGDRGPEPHRDHAGHRPRLGRLAVDRVPGAQRRRHGGADRRRSPGARARGGGPTRLSAQPTGPRPARGQDDAARDHRPGDLRPVLRHGRRGGLGAGPGAWLQRRARQRPQRGRTRRSSCTPCSRPATATASSSSATCATSRACSTTSRASKVPVVALWTGSTLAGIDTVNVDNRAGVADGHRPPRRASVTAASGSSARARTATSASARRPSSTVSPSSGWRSTTISSSPR